MYVSTKTQFAKKIFCHLFELNIFKEKFLFFEKGIFTKIAIIFKKVLT